MKKLIKLTFLIAVVLFLVFPRGVSAEAGLSEAGRTKYFKINDQYGLSVLPGTQHNSGYDSVEFFAYKENPNNNGLLSSMCSGEYIIDERYDGAYFAYQDVFYQNGFIWSSNVDSGGYLVELETGQVWDFAELSSESENKLVTDMLDHNVPLRLSEEQVVDFLLTEKGLSESQAEIFDYEYIKKNYETLDIDGLQGMNCFLTGWMILVYSVPIFMVVGLIAGVTTLLVKHFKKLKSKDRK